MHRAELAREVAVELDESGDGPIDDRHARAHAGGDRRGRGTGDPAAENHDLGRGDPGDAADQQAAPSPRPGQRHGAGLRGQPARDLAHRCEEREPSLRVLDRLVRDAPRAGVGERQGQERIGSEMQIGEQRVLLGEPVDLARAAAP